MSHKATKRNTGDGELGEAPAKSRLPVGSEERQLVTRLQLGRQVLPNMSTAGLDRLLLHSLHFTICCETLSAASERRAGPLQDRPAARHTGALVAREFLNTHL